jgi:hypothetical protein
MLSSSVMNRRLRTPIVLGFVVASLAAYSTLARADEHLVIKDTGHPIYTLELEPHLLVGVGGPFGTKPVLGPGARLSIPILHEGFLKKVNDSVAIGVGADFGVGGHDGTVVAIPVVLQWNFWLSTHWSLFGEPGLGFGTGGGRQGGDFHPVISGGGRYHFSEAIALTLRGGFPGFSVGLSIFL